MDSKFLDTNIFIEIFVRFGNKSDKCKKLIDSEEGLYTNLIAISEIEWVLRSFYDAKRSIVVKCIKKILSSKIEIENKKILIKVVDFYAKNTVDWTDCINMFLIKDQNILKVYSYDRGLNKFDWIKRLEP